MTLLYYRVDRDSATIHRTAASHRCLPECVSFDGIYCPLVVADYRCTSFFIFYFSSFSLILGPSSKRLSEREMKGKKRNKLFTLDTHYARSSSISSISNKRLGFKIVCNTRRPLNENTSFFTHFQISYGSREPYIYIYIFTNFR